MSYGENTYSHSLQYKILIRLSYWLEATILCLSFCYLYYSEPYAYLAFRQPNKCYKFLAIYPFKARSFLWAQDIMNNSIILLTAQLKFKWRLVKDGRRAKTQSCISYTVCNQSEVDVSETVARTGLVRM